ncbi:MAG: pilus assembly protein N-terminal domain-containing protein [Selenomonadaceae bacterium]|nr:pilus assembly protein N-terminal domain-containing protein [Selenomonadaceae bacterium]
MSHSFLKKFFLTAAAFAIVTPNAYAAPETLSISVKTSHYMNMGQQITRIAVGNPGVASIVQLPGSASEFLIVTKENPSSTALFVWTADGVRHEYLIVVSPEDPGQAMLIENAIGLPNVHVRMVGERILLTGTVENQYEKNYALQTARLFMDGSSESSILVGSGFDTSLNTTSASNVGRSGNLEMSKSENKGKIIDMLQILHPTQIRLEAQIIEINSNNAKDLGVQYGESGSDGKFYFGKYYKPANTNIRIFDKPAFEWLSNRIGPINATISLLVSEGKAKVLSRPSVTTLSGEQATIQIGGKVPYTTTNANGSTNTQFENYGIILQFKPVVDSQNRINSMVHAEVSNIGEYMNNGLPLITTRSADSVINLDSGAPIVIGGLMDSSESKRISKIPLLGDIPILGEFFKHTSRSKDKRELIIVVTPYLVNNEDNSQADMSQSMQEWYNQEQAYKDSMDKKDFKETATEPVIEEPPPPPPPRILPPSRINNPNNTRSTTNKKSETDKRNKSKDEIVEFALDEPETERPFDKR